MDLDYELKVSRGFLWDHIDRLYSHRMVDGVRHYVHVDQPESVFRVIRGTKAHLFLAMTFGALWELKEDASFYADEREFDPGLRAGARAVVRAIHDQYTIG